MAVVGKRRRRRCGVPTPFLRRRGCRSSRWNTARFAASPGRAGEGLHDVEPFIGLRTGGNEAEVIAMPALGGPQTKLERGSGDALRGILGTHAQVEPSGAASSIRNGSAGAMRSLTPKAKSRARIPMLATFHSRAVAGRSMPRVSATSWPCAQVSISRPLAIESGPIGGPNHGRFSPAGIARKVAARSVRLACQRASSTDGAV